MSIYAKIELYILRDTCACQAKECDVIWSRLPMITFSFQPCFLIQITITNSRISWK